MDISETLAPNSNQLDNIDLRGEAPRIFTVTKVDVRLTAEQPVTVHFAEFPRPWKPGKNMRRVLSHCWGRESDNWPGERVELFSDEAVKFGNETPGGTRISRITGIDGPTKVPIMLSQGKPGIYKVDPLPTEPDTPARDWQTVLATAAGLTDTDKLGELWKREQVGSAPDAIREQFLARVAAVKGEGGES